MKKVMAAVLCAAMLLMSLNGCGRLEGLNDAVSGLEEAVGRYMRQMPENAALPTEAADPFTESSDSLIRKNVIVEGSIFGGATGDCVEAEIVFDPAWLIYGDNTVYHPELAAFSALLCADSYFRDKDMDRGTQNRVLYADGDGSYDTASLLSPLGFTAVQKVESYKLKDYAFDQNDSVTMVLGYLPTDECDIYTAAIRGCFSIGEWASAFDPGTEDPSYEAVTGPHPEWTDKAHLKGVDIAKNRAIEFIDAFMAENGDPELPDKLLLAGHSRGGAIANLLGAYLEQNSGADCFTYTFNSLPVTEASDAESYRTVFNLFDSGDFFVRLFPFANTSMKRYGVDLPFDVQASEAVQATVAAMRGRDDYAVLTEEQFSEYDRLFRERFPDKAALYQTREVKRTFPTEAEAAASRNGLASLAGSENGLGLEAYTAFGEVSLNGAGQYEYTFTYCDAALLLSYAMLLAYGPVTGQNIRDLFPEDEGGLALSDFLADHYALLSGGHSLILDYVIGAGGF